MGVPGLLQVRVTPDGDRVSLPEEVFRSAVTYFEPQSFHLDLTKGEAAALLQLCRGSAAKARSASLAPGSRVLVPPAEARPWPLAAVGSSELLYDLFRSSAPLGLPARDPAAGACSSAKAPPAEGAVDAGGDTPQQQRQQSLAGSVMIYRSRQDVLQELNAAAADVSAPSGAPDAPAQTPVEASQPEDVPSCLNLGFGAEAATSAAAALPLPATPVQTLQPHQASPAQSPYSPTRAAPDAPAGGPHRAALGHVADCIASMSTAAPGCA